jgi:PAS domain S-box-containing protein
MDIKTVLFSYLVSNAICSAVIFSLWYQNRKQFNGLDFWLADYVMQFIGLALVVMRGRVPDFVSMVGGNGFAIGGTVLLYIGLERFLGKRSNQFHNYVVWASFLAIHTWFVFADPNLTARNINLSLALIALCSQCAWLMLRRVDVELRPVARGAGFVFAAYGAVNLVRIFVDLVVPSGENLFSLNLYDTVMVMLYQMFFIALTFSLFMMVNRRLTMNLQEDIVGRKRAEEALRFSEEKFFKAFHSSPDSVTITRVSDGRFVEVNEGFSRTTGYTRAEVLNSTTVALQLWANLQDRESVIQALRKELAVRNAEYDFRTKSGSILNGLLSAEIIQLGNEPHIVSVIHDITERKRMEAALEERERLARELHDGSGQTLGFINLQADAARESLRQGHEESAVGVLARLSEVAQEAHGDLRGYIHRLKSEIPAAPEGFFSALEQYCEHLRQAYLFEVTLSFPTPLPKRLASAQVETHLTYIIREALSNARRYSGQDQATIAIEVDDETIQAVIEDQGVGMREQYTGPERRARERLGIQIMHERVNEVDGALTIASEAGKGTRVIVGLPRKLSAKGLSQLRIVVVDDYPLFVEGLRNMLATRGAQLIGIAKDGVEAQEMARALKPGLVLMDINMPRMGGLEATRRIKAEMPDMKIVMMTTSASEERLFEALRAGAAGYLLKGMSADKFSATLDSIVRGEAEFSEEIARTILAEFSAAGGTDEQQPDSAPPTEPGVLTRRQTEVLRLVAGGLMYKEIGERLFLTESTVKYHMGEILARLHLKGRREAEEYAKRRGIK